MTRYLYFLSMFVLLRSSPNVGLPAHQDFAVSRHVVEHAGIRPRSEIDLTTEKQVLFCAGQNKSLECVSPGSTIAIMDTFWGRLTDKICPSEDGDPTTNCGSDSSTTSLLKNLCDDKVFCEIPARHTVLQAPGTTHCPGVNKYLIVNYTCMPIERKFVLCDGETTSLRCGEGWKLNIMSALWGRMSPATCATTLGRPSRLGKCDTSNNTLEKVRSICQGRNGCVVRADDEHMIEGSEKHCPDVDKYAMVSYRCQPRVEQENVLQSSKESSLNSEQGFVPDNPTKIIPFINHDSQSKDYHANSNTPYLLETTMPKNPPQRSNNKLNNDVHPGSSLDVLLKEYMDSQNGRSGDDTTGEQINIPHDAGHPPPKEKLGVPQDSVKESLQQNISLLKNILHSKKIMKVGDDAMGGIDMATAVSAPHGSKADHPGTHPDQYNDELPKKLDLTPDELEHLARSPDAIKIINEYMNKNKTKQETPLTTFQRPNHHSMQASTSKLISPSQHTNSRNSQNKKVGSNGAEKLDRKISEKQKSEQLTTTITTTTPTPSSTMSTLGTTVKTNRKDLSKLMDPTAKLGGKVMGNMFYDKFLKSAQEKFENQAKNADKNTEGKAIQIMGKKISALQTISDALTLITSKLDPDQVGGKRHDAGKNSNKYEVGNGLLDVPESVGAKDVQFLQDKINKAIETTEAMERQAVIKNPSLVALKLKGKVAQDVQAETRNIVQQRKERVKINKQIKGIEDSFNLLIEKAEKSGKFSDVDIKNKPTSSLFEELQSGALKMPFNDQQTQGRHTDNSTKGIYGFEVVGQEPEINIINEKNNTVKINTLEASKSFSATSDSPQRSPENHNSSSTNLPEKAIEQSKMIQLAPHIASKAANSIANALRRQSSNRSLFSIVLKPITTFNNIQGVTLGGRINSEFIKEKEREKLYQGKDVNALLNMIKSRLTKTKLAQQAGKQGGKDLQVPDKDLQVPGNDKLVPGKDVQVPGEDVQVPGKDVQVPGKDVQVPGKDAQAPGKDAQVPGNDLQVTGKDFQVAGKDVQVPGKDVQVPGNDLAVPGNDLQVSSKDLQAPGKDIDIHGQNMQNTGKDGQVAEVKTVGTLDEKSVKLLSVLVKGFLTHNKEAGFPRHHRHKKKKQKKEQAELEDEDFVIGAKHDEMLRSMDSQSKVPDSDILDMLEKQLTTAQTYDYKIDNLVSDARENEGVDHDTVKSVPNDKENEATEDDNLVVSPTMKPLPAPSDDPSLEHVNKYTGGTNLDRLLLSLQKMLKQGQTEVESHKKVATSSAQVSMTESASKNSLQSKPRVVEFSRASTSGKIINPLYEGKTINSKVIQGIKQFAGGRILEPANTEGMKPVSQETISIISANPTAKSKVGAAQVKNPISKFNLTNLVSGVKLLLKALREKNSESHVGRHEERLEEDDDRDDKNDAENLTAEESENDTDEEANENALKNKGNKKQTGNYNGFLDYAERPKHKGTSSWYVGEGNTYNTDFYHPKSYGDEQYINLPQQYASNPKEYSTFTSDTFSSPYRSFALQPSNSYEYLPKPAFQDPYVKPYTNKLTIPAKHALNSALRNDPIIQAVEEFSDNERQLYNEKLRGIQKNHIPGKQDIH